MTNQDEWHHLNLTPKQYIDNEISHLKEIREKDQQQLKIQATEYERRLTELNHAHERAETDRHQYITVAVYDTTQRDIRALIEVQRNSAERATNLAESNARDIARLTNTLSWLTRTIVGAVLVAIVAFFLKPPIPVSLP